MVNNNDSLKFIKAIEQLIEKNVKRHIKRNLTHREVIIKRVHNRESLNKRRVDVVFADEISQSMPIINIPVNVPYDIVEGDRAYLTYSNDRPENGYISQIITYKGDREMGGGKYEIRVINENELPSNPPDNVIFFIKE